MTFASNETGAVTVDWVVLTAALVGLGLATMAVVSTGVQDTSDDIEDQLEATEITGLFSSTMVARFDPTTCGADSFDGIKAVAAAMVAEDMTDGDGLPGIEGDIDGWQAYWEQQSDDALSTGIADTGAAWNGGGGSYDEGLEVAVMACVQANR